NRAYWGPPVKVGPVQPALNVDMDAETNVDGLNFTYRSDQKKLPVLMIHNQLTKIPIPVPLPDISLLNPPLGLIPAIPRGIELLKDVAKQSIPQAILQGLNRASRTSDVLTASGSLDVLRYGHLLKARRLVGVRGAGDPFDGLYYVEGVTHTLKRGEYKQSFNLSRNGLKSTIPNVPT